VVYKLVTVHQELVWCVLVAAYYQACHIHRSQGREISFRGTPGTLVYLL